MLSPEDIQTIDELLDRYKNAVADRIDDRDTQEFIAYAERAVEKTHQTMTDCLDHFAVCHG